MSKKNAIRVEGLKQLGSVGVRQIPVVDKLEDTKVAYEGTYKLVRGKRPRPLLNRAQRWMYREFMPAGVAAMEGRRRLHKNHPERRP